MHRFAMIALSLSLILSLAAAGRLAAQDEKKKEEPKTESKTQKDDASKKTDESKKDETKKDDTKKEAAEVPLPSIPPEVEAKLEAARRAVADAIIAAQDAGLVETTIDPPPILDILVTGRATDARELKNKKDTSPEVGVSPEVFGAWFTGYGKMDGITAEKNVRITQPSKGLIDYYSRRKAVFEKHLADARKAKGEPPKKEEAKPTEEPKKEEVKKEEPKKDEAKPKAEEKKDETKKEEPKKDESKP